MEVTENQLQSFVIEENQNLERIRSQLREFNPFDVLGIQYFEIRHSNFLAWMFDPAGSHNIGDYFLKGFITLLERLQAGQKISLFLADLTKTRVYREWNNIDILLINDEQRIVMPIENKVWAGKTGDGQLVKYAKLVSRLYAHDGEDQYTICPVYLTPFNRMLTSEEENEGYQNVLYKDILQLLTKTVTDIEPEKAITDFINYYIDNVTKRIMNDDKSDLNILAHQIYRKHKTALEFIMSKKPIIYSEANFRTIVNWLSEHPDYLHLKSHDYIVRFLPRSVADVFAYPDFHSWGFEQCFCIEIFLNENNLTVKFCAGGVNNEPAYDRLQKVKDNYFEQMKKFDSIKGIIKRSRSTSQYPAVAEVPILTTDEELFYESSSFREAFITAFNQFEERYLKNWTKEVEAKKNLLFPR